MTANEMAQKVKEDARLNGLDMWVDARRNAVEVYGFQLTSDWKLTKAILAEMGFNCAPNMATWREEIPVASLREQYEAMTDEQKKAADAHFEKMARS